MGLLLVNVGCTVNAAGFKDAVLSGVLGFVTSTTSGALSTLVAPFIST